MGSIPFTFVVFLVILFHNGFALHYKYDPRWKWKENQFIDLNQEIYRHKSDEPETTSEIHTTPSSTYPPVVKGTSEGSGSDEDLLDLMVRIAETPAEWEKIHQVLNQLGKSKIKTNSSQNGARKEDTQTLKSSTTNKPSTHAIEIRTKNIIETDKDNEIGSVETGNRHNENKYLGNNRQMWPDIFKNEYEKLFWNAQNIYDEEMQEDDDDDENYFSEYQLDEEDKSVNKKDVNSFNRIEAVGRIGKNNVNKDSASLSVNKIVNKTSSNVKSSVDKFDFVHFLNTVTNRPRLVNSSHDNNSTIKDNWPNFSYHRVTVSPKEKFKNLSKAFIVVSEISPKHNETAGNLVDEGMVKPAERDSLGPEPILFSEIPRDGRLNSKTKVYRHHWRDKQKTKHSKRRHHRTHPHDELTKPSPDF